jgi:hypothetical protein
MAIVKPLSPEQLYKHTDPNDFPFETTSALGDFEEIIGQPRAVQAVQFGAGIEHDGYNIFALGPPGTGKRSLVTKFFREKSRTEEIPDDWCYVYNFEHDYRPKAIHLPAGRGIEFQRDMGQFVEELRTTLVAFFESEEYRARKRVIEEEIQEEQENLLEILQAKAGKDNLALLRTPSGFIFAPTQNGEVLPPEKFNELSEEARQVIEKRVAELQDELQKLLQNVPIW